MRHLANASADGRAYFPRLRTETCPDILINIGVDAPSSAASLGLDGDLCYRVLRFGYVLFTRY